MAISFLEADIEKMIFDNKTTIKDRGFIDFFENTNRQFRLPSGKIIDILSVQETPLEISFKILELKRGEINLETLEQALEYCAEYLKIASASGKNIKYEIILCGDSICAILDSLLTIGLRIQAYLYKFDFNGLYFSKVESVGYEPNFATKIKLNQV